MVKDLVTGVYKFASTWEEISAIKLKSELDYLATTDLSKVILVTIDELGNESWTSHDPETFGPVTEATGPNPLAITPSSTVEQIEAARVEALTHIETEIEQYRQQKQAEINSWFDRHAEVAQRVETLALTTSTSAQP
jgi:hypothetical protein